MTTDRNKEWGTSNQPYPGCPFCGEPVSLIGNAREGKLLHKCPQHGWVSPIPTYGLPGWSVKV